MSSSRFKPLIPRTPPPYTYYLNGPTVIRQIFRSKTHILRHTDDCKTKRFNVNILQSFHQYGFYLFLSLFEVFIFLIVSK